MDEPFQMGLFDDMYSACDYCGRYHEMELGLRVVCDECTAENMGISVEQLRDDDYWKSLCD